MAFPWIAAMLVAGALLLALLGVAWLTAVVAWGDRRARGLGYFGLPRRERERFRRRIRFHATILAPVIRLLARASPFSFEKASFRYGGVPGPRGTCTPESFEAGASYRPRPSDVFVVTQMRSGTTWMQHVVYEVLMRGRGDLVEEERTLGAVSPWLESVIGVPVERAPSLGRERPSRLIKTHFPASLCPDSPEARYVYVVRHPVSCFASCVDFLVDDMGVAAPSLDVFAEWFCDDERMWWGGWPRHVEGWWSRSRRQDNVLFVRFEDMLEDLPGVVGDLASFLEVEPLDDAETGAVVRKTGFDYMKRHREAFEMYPPHVLATDSSYFSRGTADRHRDVRVEVRRRIEGWCRDELADGPLDLDRLYPGVAGARGNATGGTEVRA